MKKNKIVIRKHLNKIRMVHISTIVAYSVIFSIVSLQLIFTVLEASAENQNYQETQNSQTSVSVSVPEIAGGPGVITDNQPQSPTPAVDDETKKAAVLLYKSVLLPDLTINRQQESPESAKIGEENALPEVFTSLYPFFSGWTNIQDADIFLEIHSQTIRATTKALPDGSWNWQSPIALEAGSHSLIITAKDPKIPEIFSQSTLQFLIKPGPTISKSPILTQSSIKQDLGNLFDIFLKVPSQFKLVPPGDEIAAEIKLINFGYNNPVDVSLEFIVQNEAGDTIMQTAETLAVATQTSLLKTFFTSPNLKQGIYKIIARVPSKDAVAIAMDTFELKGEAIIPVTQNSKADFSLIYQALMAILFLLFIVGYFEYNKLTLLSRYLTPVNETLLFKYLKST